MKYSKSQVNNGSMGSAIHGPECENGGGRSITIYDSWKMILNVEMIYIFQILGVFEVL